MESPDKLASRDSRYDGSIGCQADIAMVADCQTITTRKTRDDLDGVNDRSATPGDRNHQPRGSLARLATSESQCRRGLFRGNETDCRVEWYREFRNASDDDWVFRHSDADSRPACVVEIQIAAIEVGGDKVRLVMKTGDVRTALKFDIRAVIRPAGSE